MSKPVAVLAAVRTPWSLRGGAMASVSAAELGAIAAREVMFTAGIRPSQVEALVVGMASPSHSSSDLPRDVGLRAELACPAHAVGMGWISAERALSTAVDGIVSGRTGMIAVVGVETPSDSAVKMSRALRETLTEIRRAQTNADAVRALASLRPADLALSFPRSVDPATGASPSTGAEVLAKRHGIERPEQDRYAARSHARAIEASRRTPSDWVVPVPVRGPLRVQVVQHDDGPKGSVSAQSLGQLDPLPPDDPHSAVTQWLATVTPGNAAPEADGAAAVLLADLQQARQRRWPILGTIEEHGFVAVDPVRDPIMGQVGAARALLQRCETEPGDLQVVELHEAFAVQVLATIAELGLQPQAVNRWGGSIALGHPAGATGLRLVATALLRMHADKTPRALVASSALGGQGFAAMLGLPG